MNPHQQNKIDVSSLSPDEQRLMRMYGKVPTKKDLLQNKLKERKYFDSGDYALSKAGKASDVGVTSVGSRHPLPENIPHLTASSPPQGGSVQNFNGQQQGHPHQGSHSGSMSHSPAKEASFLHRGTSIDEQQSEQSDKQKGDSEEQPGTPSKPQQIRKGSESEENLSVSPPQAKEGLPIRR